MSFLSPFLEQSQQCTFCLMKSRPSMPRQVLSLIEIMIDYFASFESIYYFWADVRRSAHRRRVAENLRRFLYRCNDLSLSNGARLFIVGANTGKRARANQS